MEIKKIIIIAIAVLFAGFVVALIVFNINASNSENIEDESIAESSEDMTLHEQYTGLPEENRFVEESASEIIDRFNSGTGVIFLGFKECPWCQKTAPLINEAAEAEGVSVYYLDIRQEREDLTPAYQEIISILSPHLPKNENGVTTISTPDISFVKDGKIIWRHEMETTTEAERTPDTYWTQERQSRAIERFKENMRQLH